MTGSPPPPINSTTQLAASLPGSDPAPVITAGDKNLADYLAMPTQQIQDKLGLLQSPNGALAAPASAGAPANPSGPINPMNPAQLISPVLSMLSTLGTGQFPGADPTNMLAGISNAFDNTSSPLQQALSAVQQGWQGASNVSAVAKTGTALANGAEVSTQANGLKGSLAAATADVAQAQSQLIAIVNEFNATVAAIGPNIIFPWGWAAIVTAANHAVTQATAVMTEVQSSLAAHASAVSAIGSPVNVTAASPLGTSMAGVLSSLLGGATGSTTSPTSAMSMLSPLMSAAQAGISPAMSAASMAGNPAAAAGAQSASLARATGADPNSAGDGSGHKSGGLGAGIPASGGGSGGASGGSGGTLVSRVTAPATLAASETPSTMMASAPTRPAMAGMSLGGGGMMGGPLAGAANAGGAHTAASYLHTSDRGDKVVGGTSTVAPPVIGEVDPNYTPDIELRI